MNGKWAFGQFKLIYIFFCSFCARDGRENCRRHSVTPGILTAVAAYLLLPSGEQPNSNYKELFENSLPWLYSAASKSE